jgi:Tfp pilus assembly protein FimT
MSGRSPLWQSHRRSALALIDLVVTVLLMGVLAAAVVPRFSGAVQRHRATSAAQRICADIRLAKNSAIASSASKRIDFNVAQGSYTLVGVASLDKPGTDYSQQLSGGTYESAIVSANLGGDASLTFDIHGQPDSGGTVVVRSGSLQVTVTINSATGEATTP